VSRGASPPPWSSDWLGWRERTACQRRILDLSNSCFPGLTPLPEGSVNSIDHSSASRRVVLPEKGTILIRLKAGGFFSKAFEADARLIASPLPQRLRTLLPRCLAVVDETKTLA
jgi:hypothetical protein